MTKLRCYERKQLLSKTKLNVKDILFVEHISDCGFVPWIVLRGFNSDLTALQSGLEPKVDGGQES